MTLNFGADHSKVEISRDIKQPQSEDPSLCPLPTTQGVPGKAMWGLWGMIYMGI